MQRFLIAGTGDLVAPDGGLANMSSLAGQDVSRAEGKLLTFRLRERHRRYVVQLELVPLNVRVPQIRDVRSTVAAGSGSFGHHLTELHAVTLAEGFDRPRAGNNADGRGRQRFLEYHAGTARL